MQATNNTNSTFVNTTAPIAHYLGSAATGIGLSIIAILAIVGNAIVCILFIYSKKLRNRPHGVLIWNLALADLLTGIFIVVTPDHIIRDAYIFPPRGTAGDIFCKLIGSEMFTFCFGYTSMYTLVVLAVERRYAVIKASKYARYFSIPRTRVMVVCVWIWGFLLVVIDLFQSVYDESKKPPCAWILLPGGPAVNMPVYGIMFILRFLLPMICLIVCYASIGRYLAVTVHNTPDSINKASTAAYRNKRKVTVTCAVTSIAFLLCWLPNQISFTLVNFGMAINNSNVHLVTKLLVLSNSFINPFIYGCTNRYYRKEFFKMLQGYRKRRSTVTSSKNTMNSSSKSYGRSLARHN